MAKHEQEIQLEQPDHTPSHKAVPFGRILAVVILVVANAAVIAGCAYVLRSKWHELHTPLVMARAGNATANNQAASAAPANASAGLRTYTSKEFGVTFEFPYTWEVQGDSDGQVTLVSPHVTFPRLVQASTADYKPDIAHDKTQNISGALTISMGRYSNDPYADSFFKDPEKVTYPGSTGPDGRSASYINWYATDRGAAHYFQVAMLDLVPFPKGQKIDRQNSQSTNPAGMLAQLFYNDVDGGQQSLVPQNVPLDTYDKLPEFAEGLAILKSIRKAQ